MSTDNLIPVKPCKECQENAIIRLARDICADNEKEQPNKVETSCDFIIRDSDRTHNINELFTRLERKMGESSLPLAKLRHIAEINKIIDKKQKEGETTVDTK